jgi:hypothetical protein
MVTWNYRVFQEANDDYIIREVFYADDGSIMGCTEKAVEPWGRTLEELAQDIDSFKEALTLPVLTLDDIPAQQMKLDSQGEGKNSISHAQLLSDLGLDSSSGEGTGLGEQRKN